jgi:hypothetical protein
VEEHGQVTLAYYFEQAEHGMVVKGLISSPILSSAIWVRSDGELRLAAG